ncbi:hypothetical protein D9M72_476580 [compost metagenome]
MFHELPQPHGGSSCRNTGLGKDGLLAGECFQAAAAAARAVRTRRINHHVAHLPRLPVGSGKEPGADDQAATDTHLTGNKQVVAEFQSVPVPELGQGSAVCLVIQNRAQRCARQQPAQLKGNIVPLQVGGAGNRSGCRVHESGHRQSAAQDCDPGGCCLGDYVVHEPGQQGHDGFRRLAAVSAFQRPERAQRTAEVQKARRDVVHVDFHAHHAAAGAQLKAYPGPAAFTVARGAGLHDQAGVRELRDQAGH